jgi:hypothetical protein
MSGQALRRGKVAITGHRLAHPGLAGRVDAVSAAIAELFETLTSPEGSELHTMLADGVDQIATQHALRMQWRVKAILPFGAPLTCAIGASAKSDDAENKRRLLLDAERANKAGERSDNDQIRAFFALARRIEVEALADCDDYFADAWIAASSDETSRQSFSEESSERYAMAARLSLDASEILVAVWNGASSDAVGGTGYTIMEALSRHLPVLWIEPETAPAVRVLFAPEDRRRPPIATSAAANIVREHLIRQ